MTVKYTVITMKIRNIHTFDTKNSLLTSVDCCLIRADGSTELIYSSTYSFDVQFDPFTEGEPFAEYVVMRKKPILSAIHSKD